MHPVTQEPTHLHQLHNGSSTCRNCENYDKTWCGVQGHHVPRKGSCWKFAPTVTAKKAVLS